MAKYEVTVEGSRYEVEAPDENTAWQWANYTHLNNPAQKKKKAGRHSSSRGLTVFCLLAPRAQSL